MYQWGSAAAPFYWLSTAQLDGDPNTNAFIKRWAISIYLDGTYNTHHYSSHKLLRILLLFPALMPYELFKASS